MPRIARTSVFILLVTLLLGACGQKGELYRPTQTLTQQRDRGDRLPHQP